MWSRCLPSWGNVGRRRQMAQRDLLQVQPLLQTIGFSQREPSWQRPVLQAVLRTQIRTQGIRIWWWSWLPEHGFWSTVRKHRDRIKQTIGSQPLNISLSALRYLCCPLPFARVTGTHSTPVAHCTQTHLAHSWPYKSICLLLLFFSTETCSLAYTLQSFQCLL